MRYLILIAIFALLIFAGCSSDTEVQEENDGFNGSIEEAQELEEVMETQLLEDEEVDLGDMI